MGTEGCVGEVRAAALSPPSPPRERHELTQRHLRLLVGSSGPGCDGAGGRDPPYPTSLPSECPHCYPFRYLSNQAMVLAHASFAASGR